MTSGACALCALLTLKTKTFPIAHFGNVYKKHSKGAKCAAHQLGGRAAARGGSTHRSLESLTSDYHHRRQY